MNPEPRLARWLRWMIYASALVPLIIFAQFQSPFHFGKVVMLRALVEAMVVLYVFLAWRNPEYRPKSSPVTWAFFTLTLAFTLTTITSVAPTQSLWGTLERMGGLFTFWHYFIFYLVTVSVLRTREHWRTLIDLMVSVGVVSAIYGFLQHLTSWSFILGSGGRERPFGTIGNTALFAGYQIILAFLGATMLLLKRFGPASGTPNTQRGWWFIGGGLFSMLFIALAMGNSGLWVVPLGLVLYGCFLVGAHSPCGAMWFYGIATATMFVAIGTTAVRGSMLAVVVAVVLFAALWSSVFSSRRGRTALLGLLSLVVVLVFAAVLLRSTSFVQNSRYLNRITNFSISTYTVQTRFWAWSAGLKGWMDSPKTVLLGWGPENFNVPFSKYFNPKFFIGPGSETFFDRAHNMFVEVLVTMGLVGELAYLALFAAVFWVLVRCMRHPDRDMRIFGVGFCTLVVAYMVHNCFIFDTSANFLTFFTVLAFIAHVAQRGLEAPATNQRLEPRNGKSRPVPWTTAQVFSGIVLVTVAAVLVYTTDVETSLANYASTRAIIAGAQGDFNRAVAKYSEAIDYNVPGRYEYRLNFAQFLLDASASPGVMDQPAFTQAALKSIAYVKQDVQEDPHDYLPLLYLARLYSMLGESSTTSPYNDQALQYSTQALTISPTFVRTYYEIGQEYLNKRDFPNAFTAFKKAADLNPNVGLSWWYAGVVDVQIGRVTEGLQYISKALDLGYRLSETDALRLVDAYLKVGDLKSVAQLYAQLTQASPTNTTYWSQLAAAYLQLGQPADAIRVTREALAANPNDAQFRAAATQFLQRLGATP